MKLKFFLNNLIYDFSMCVLLVFFIFSMIFSSVGIVAHRRLIKRVAVQKQALVVIESEISNLKQDIERWQKSDFYLEKVARNDLGMGYANELVYIRRS